LLDGKAWTATELSACAGVSAPTASGHLRNLVNGKLLVTEKRGRHRHFRLAGHKVAEALEALAGLAADIGRQPMVSKNRSRSRPRAIRTPRVCTAMPGLE
jgi:hypothetical protein